MLVLKLYVLEELFYGQIYDSTDYRAPLRRRVFDVLAVSFHPICVKTAPTCNEINSRIGRGTRVSVV